ncbi:MAG: hypothetical protein V1857_04290 [archaeon]
MRNYVPEHLTILEPNQVLVFGTNASGFHGAGMAGLACRGDAQNTWRNDPWFLRAMKSSLGSSDRVGKWAVYGVSRGFQHGREGWSYGIETIHRPGLRRSTPLPEILKQLVVLSRWADNLSQWTFLCYITGGGYNGWTREEMQGVYCDWFSSPCPPPNNIWIPEKMDPTKRIL